MNELKRIWIFAIGSRGDVQPYVAVAHELVKNGYEVTFFCVGPSFAAFAESFGCKGVALGDQDVDAFIRSSPKIMKAMMNGDVFTLFKGMNQKTERAVPSYCETFLREVEEHGPPDLSMTMPLTNYFGWYLAIRHKVHFLPMTVFAAVYNPEHPPFGLPKLPLGLGSYLFHNVMIGSLYDGIRGYEKHLKAGILEKLPLLTFKAHIREPPVPLLVLSSPEIANVLAGGPDKLPSQIYRIVGTTIIHRDLQLEKIDSFGGELEFDRLKSFVESGEKPVYLGWGSMICRSEKFMVKLCARAVHHSGHRAIILGGFAGLSMELLESTDIEPVILEYAKRNILFVRQAPHEWLFPRVSVIVHHGGAGTTTAALRAGVPSVITPVFADQWDCSFFLRKTGVGVGFEKQFQKIDSKELGDAVRGAAADSKMQLRARILGEKLRAEDGVTRAVDEIERFWREFCVTGRFHSVFPGNPLPKRVTDETWFRYAVAFGVVVATGCAIAFSTTGSLQPK